MNYYNVAVKTPIFHLLTYQSENSVPLGSFVSVPLGSRIVKGVVMESTSNPTTICKDILEVDLEFPPLDSKRRAWLQWLSNYYFYPVGMVALSSYVEKKKTYNLKPKELSKDARLDPLILTEDQYKCLQSIESQKGFYVHLLHGVTGSGKTEVYLKLIEDRVKKNKGALILVPEISLTPQLFLRFDSRFKNQVSVLHSGLTPKQKYTHWTEAVQGNKPIVLGARSALFCPIKNLSLIILDEEHETHFKQEEKLKYHCRDAAIMLGQQYNIPVILGSATPSVETWFKAKEAKYHYHLLDKRFKNKSLPKMHVIDLKQEDKNQKPSWMSGYLSRKISDSLSKKHQVALFLNRRGEASLTLCSYCKAHVECPHCDISLTLHKKDFLVCHYCDYSIHSKQLRCANCDKEEWLHLGIGTEKIYEDVKKLFPEARVRLADSDHVQTSNQFKSIVKDMMDQKVDILIGTQMIAKGLDFEGLNLVGIILADLTLYCPDFRASERNFQLITQMGGRCGRHGDTIGEVVIQTYNSDHYSIQYGSLSDFKSMAEEELKNRKKLNYPPFTRLLSIRVVGKTAHQARKEAENLKTELTQWIQKYSLQNQCQCLGPAPSSIFKLRLKYRYQILIKSSSSQVIDQIGKAILSFQKKFSSISLDRDPYFL